MPNGTEVTEDADLNQLYSPPSELVVKAIAHRLHAHHRDYLAQATFFSFATVRDVGLDVSPRGGPPGFVHVLDDQTIAFGDWPGNNKIESMRNLVHDDRVALLFIFPGLEIFLRINGRARISIDSDLLSRVAEGRRVCTIARKPLSRVSSSISGAQGPTASPLSSRIRMSAYGKSRRSGSRASIGGLRIAPAGLRAMWSKDATSPGRAAGVGT